MPNPVTSRGSLVSTTTKARSTGALTRIPSLSDRKPLSPTARIAAIGDVVEDLWVGVLVSGLARIVEKQPFDIVKGTHQRRIDKSDSLLTHSNPLLVDSI